jgi:hypothetical protein
MTWHAHLTHTPTGLALTFAEPISRLDMTPDVAEHLASLLAVEARHVLLRVVGKLEAENGSRAVVVSNDGHARFCVCLACTNGLPENGGRP